MPPSLNIDDVNTQRAQLHVLSMSDIDDELYATFGTTEGDIRVQTLYIVNTRRDSIKRIINSYHSPTDLFNDADLSNAIREFKDTIATNLKAIESVSVMEDNEGGKQLHTLGYSDFRRQLGERIRKVFSRQRLPHIFIHPRDDGDHHFYFLFLEDESVSDGVLPNGIKRWVEADWKRHKTTRGMLFKLCAVAIIMNMVISFAAPDHAGMLILVSTTIAFVFICTLFIMMEKRINELEN